MRRWLVILMLTLLPLQFSWAAVAAYCTHEASPNAEHVGHHAHQHAGGETAQPKVAKTDAGKLAGMQDLDCAQCHAACALPLRAEALTDGRALPTARGGDAAEAVRTRAASPPERPQWLRLA